MGESEAQVIWIVGASAAGMVQLLIGGLVAWVCKSIIDVRERIIRIEIKLKHYDYEE